MISAVQGELHDGVVVLTVDYRSDPHEDAVKLADKMKSEYQSLVGAEKRRSCVLEIEASVVDTPFAKALFLLYRHVTSLSGRLFCVGYPEKDLPTLRYLGLPKLDGFSLEKNRGTALKKARPAA
ncbi:MAG: hypothetical protein HY235_03815 [Acidobacteria bacterium]|nr:hypothetical protein [Acidobacteriota bacterium]